jgi:O-antigen/teichoic acid export membrane protein
MGAAATVMMIFGDKVLLLWTQDPPLVRCVAPLLPVLALGTLFNGLMWMPYHLQLAHGWTSLTIKLRSVAVVILIPAILWAVPAYGALGAAWVWVTLNAGYILFDIYFIHRRLLPTEKLRWYREDVAIPLAAATATAWLCRWGMPVNEGRLDEFGVLVMSFGIVLLVAALAAPLVRYQLARSVPDRIKGIEAKSPNECR